MSAPVDRKAVLLLLFGASVIGAGTVLVRLAGAGAAAAGGWRLLFALPWLLVLTGLERRRGGGRGPARPAGRWGAPLPILLLCGLTFALDLTFWHYSLRLTAIANSTVLANLTPVIVTVMAWLLFRERPAPVFVGGLVLALGGAAVMALAKGQAGAQVAPLLGDGLAVGASFWYAFYFLAVRTARRTASALQVMLASSLVGLPLVFAAAALFHERLAPSTPGGWAACVALGVMHVSGQGAIAWSLGRVPTALAAVVVLCQPVVAALAGWLVFGEAVGPVQGLGALLALGGIALAQAAARRTAPPVEGGAEAAAA
jgi:drug/metabolite transporter (DMT)-like permease